MFKTIHGNDMSYMLQNQFIGHQFEKVIKTNLKTLDKCFQLGKNIIKSNTVKDL